VQRFACAVDGKQRGASTWGGFLRIVIFGMKNGAQMVVRCPSTGAYTTARQIFKSATGKTIAIPCKIADIHFQDPT
jgi:hypothetical protein